MFRETYNLKKQFSLFLGPPRMLQLMLFSSLLVTWQNHSCLLPLPVKLAGKWNLSRQYRSHNIWGAPYPSHHGASCNAVWVQIKCTDTCYFMTHSVAHVIHHQWQTDEWVRIRGKNLSYCHFAQHKIHTDCHGTRSGIAQWQAEGPSTNHLSHGIDQITVSNERSQTPLKHFWKNSTNLAQ